MKPPAAALPSSSEVAAYVANCFGDMESDIDRIVATAEIMCTARDFTA